MAKKRIKINMLKITSTIGDYDVPFEDGLNIVSGPYYTGKSSILKLIDYCCGARTPIDYPEIKHCSDVMVEFLINDEPLTISRSLRAPSSDALYFDATISEIRTRKIGGIPISYKQAKNTESISSLILKRLGLWNIPIKVAPTQESSKSHIFSIRELMRTIYFDQSRVSSEMAFFEADPTKKFGYQAAFEIINEIHNDKAATLSRQIKEVEEEIQQLESELKATKKFLDSFDVPSIDSLEQSKKELEDKIQTHKKKIDEFRERSGSLLGKNSGLVDQRAALISQIEEIEARILNQVRGLKNLNRLKTQYDREISQLQFLEESDKLIGQIPIIRCPACLQEISSTQQHQNCHVCSKELPNKEGEIPISTRLRSVRHKSSGLNKFILELESDLNDLERQKIKAQDSLSELDKSIDRMMKDFRIPAAREAAELERTLADFENELKKVVERISFRLKAQGDGTRLPRLKDRLEGLKSESQIALTNTVSREQVITELSERLEALLNEFEFVASEGARIDISSFVPIIRNQSYGRLSSLGAIGLVISSYALSILEHSLAVDTAFPMLLMLDSPLNQLGKDNSPDPFRDQRTINKFYTHLLKLHEQHASQFQIIIVDNKTPTFMDGRVTTRFTGEDKGRYGLISPLNSKPESTE